MTKKTEEIIEKRKVLIVDDSSFTRRKCIQYLDEENLEIYEAGNGQEAVDMVDKILPDVILMDVVMPGMDGYEACNLIKNGAHPEIPVIIVTTKSEDEDLIKGFESGADDYIIKPYKQEELKARVSATIRTKVLYDKLSIQNKELEDTNAELKATKEKLKEQEKIALIGQLMVGIHHEIRNPLTAVLANSQILIRHFDVGEEGDMFLSDIEAQAKKIKDILDQIKDMDTVEVVDYVDDTKMVRIK